LNTRVGAASSRYRFAAADRARIISLGEDLPKLWNAASAVERKQILRLVVKEVVLDQQPQSGQVWIRTIWQTGAVSEHKVRRNVSSYRNYAGIATLEGRVRDLVVARKMDREIATALNGKAYCRPTVGRSAAVRSTCCANVGISQRWRSTVQNTIPDNGLTGHTPLKEPPRRFRFPPKPSSNGFRKDDYRASR
jgi:hypothetical protein